MENMDLSEKEMCVTVPSQQGRDMLIIRDYLMWRHSSIKATYYWRCRDGKLYSCKSRAVTRLSSTGKHVLTKCSDHNHPPNAYKTLESSKTIANSRTKAHNFSALLQSCVTSVRLKLLPSMTSESDVRQKINVEQEVCSNHFVDGAPSISNPIPTLNIDPHPKEKESRNKSSNNLNLSFNLKPYKSLIADLNKTQEDYEKQQQQQQKIGPLREPPQRSATTVLEEVQYFPESEDGEEQK